VAANLAAAVAASIICGVQRRAAATQRRLLTRCDPLTEVPNRRGFEEELARRADRPVALLILDLDGFKQVNDVRGHAAGNELPCWVATTVTGFVTAGDAVGRLGGDEFVVLVEGDPAPVARCLRTALGARTAVSVGMAVRGVHGTGFEDLYAHADAELYRQKAAARSVSTEPQVYGQPAEHRPHEPALDP
jgi:diguanylate cyclase (GGDEF)-like protein